ncbi:phosphatase PAP2 family protein [Novosphingobium taihuense]|uniref:Undecaprenyl-diphosphatase n=1 Tax=Novosphingobium taihuense TaxID=260085 RepID=A0A7W7AAX6_9SPHN|nr:phosphatase PAP2 family protein [Novosphingobium taihuense]MBB4613644.1 undecaprenyl-diphosphatase [Novosphingobium taihuense]TWH81113.1 undecaprenyl-diphosphatase [Novosphingobium taihuense]
MIEAAPERHLPQRARSWRISPRHALIAAAICWTGFVVVTVLVLGGRSSGIDNAGLMFWRRGAELAPAGPQWLLEAVRDLTSLGGVLLRNLIMAGVLAALLFLRLRREAVLLAATAMGGWVVNSLVKLAVGRPRPLIVPHLTEAGGQSFPSGHSFNSAVVYIAIALAFAAMSPRRDVRWTLVATAIVLSIAIAISRVWLGVHFPTDVAAGWLGGAGWAFLASALLHRPAKAMAEQAGDMLDTLTPRG